VRTDPNLAKDGVEEHVRKARVRQRALADRAISASRPAQIRETSDFEIPDPTPRAPTRSSTLRVPEREGHGQCVADGSGGESRRARAAEPPTTCRSGSTTSTAPRRSPPATTGRLPEVVIGFPPRPQVPIGHQREQVPGQPGLRICPATDVRTHTRRIPTRSVDTPRTASRRECVGGPYRSRPRQSTRPGSRIG
jgi:hypothetical protein